MHSSGFLISKATLWIGRKQSLTGFGTSHKTCILQTNIREKKRLQFFRPSEREGDAFLLVQRVQRQHPMRRHPVPCGDKTQDHLWPIPHRLWCIMRFYLRDGFFFGGIPMTQPLEFWTAGLPRPVRRHFDCSPQPGSSAEVCGHRKQKNVKHTYTLQRKANRNTTPKKDMLLVAWIQLSFTWLLLCCYGSVVLDCHGIISARPFWKARNQHSHCHDNTARYTSCKQYVSQERIQWMWHHGESFQDTSVKIWTTSKGSVPCPKIWTDALFSKEHEIGERGHFGSERRFGLTKILGCNPAGEGMSDAKHRTCAVGNSILVACIGNERVLHTPNMHHKGNDFNWLKFLRSHTKWQWSKLSAWMNAVKTTTRLIGTCEQEFVSDTQVLLQCSHCSLRPSITTKWIAGECKSGTIRRQKLTPELNDPGMRARTDKTFLFEVFLPESAWSCSKNWDLQRGLGAHLCVPLTLLLFYHDPFKRNLHCSLKCWYWNGVFSSAWSLGPSGAGPKVSSESAIADNKSCQPAHMFGCPEHWYCNFKLVPVVRSLVPWIKFWIFGICHSQSWTCVFVYHLKARESKENTISFWMSEWGVHHLMILSHIWLIFRRAMSGDASCMMAQGKK